MYDRAIEVRRRILAGIARQAGHPAGFAGRLMGVALNVGDRKDVTAAVDALSIPPKGAVADVGFGGGIGISLLLDPVDAGGKVHGGGGVFGDAQPCASPVW